MLTATRPAAQARDKHELLLTALRQQIVSNQLPPNSRLPRRVELLRDFRVTPGTLQRVMATLKEDGLITAHRRGGTRVAAHPPHLARYGVVLPSTPDQPARWSRYWQALLWATLAYPATDDCQLVPYYGDLGSAGRRGGGLAAAEADLTRGRLAGLVFAHVPLGLRSSPLLTHAGLPRVAVMSPGPTAVAVPGIAATVWFSYAALLDQACAWLAAQGRRRIALLGHPSAYASLAGNTGEPVAPYALVCPPAWRCEVTWQDPAGVGRALARLFHGPAHARPDGLVVLDDNLIDTVCAWCLAADVRLPHDLAVVSQWNHPNPLPGFAPVHYVGFDISQVLQTAVNLLADLRQGLPTPAHTELSVLAAPAPLATPASPSMP